MSASRFKIEPLGRRHNRAAFSCGVEALDRYLQQQASQDVRRRVAAVFILNDTANGRVAGYYTLSATSIEPADMPEELVRRMPPYRTLPAVLLGRLAIDQQYRSQGLGARLLYDSLERALTQSEQIAAMAVMVDAIDENAAGFYAQYGFLRLGSDPRRLFLPMQTINALLDGP